MKLNQIVLSFIQRHQLFKAGDRVVVAVSGGADSIALAHLLIKARAQLGIHLYLAHYNHRLRKAADADQRFVAQFAKKFQIPLVVGARPDVSKLPLMSEDEARRLRFNFLIQTAHQCKASSIALAHTENDLAETVLMRLIRGAGLYGLRGILAMRDMQGVAFIRPLIHCKRFQIESYLEEQGLSFRTDRTNLKPVYLRNKIRLKLLPQLALEYNPSISRVLTGIASVAQEDYDFLAQEAQKRFKENVVRKNQTVKISLIKMRREHPAMQRLLIRMMYESVTQDSSALTFDHICAVSDLLGAKAQGVKVSLPKYHHAVNTGKSLEIS